MAGNTNVRKFLANAKRILEAEYDGKSLFSLLQSNDDMDDFVGYFPEDALRLYDRAFMWKGNSLDKKSGRGSVDLLGTKVLVSKIVRSYNKASYFIGSAFIRNHKEEDEYQHRVSEIKRDLGRCCNEGYEGHVKGVVRDLEDSEYIRPDWVENELAIYRAKLLAGVPVLKKRGRKLAKEEYD